MFGRLAAATHVALNGQVLAGRFRADLYHRLAVVVLELPPLRVRGEDIVVLYSPLVLARRLRALCERRAREVNPDSRSRHSTMLNIPWSEADIKAWWQWRVHPPAPRIQVRRAALS